jgi:hypothetical protein
VTSLALIPPHEYALASINKDQTYLFLPQFLGDTDYKEYVKTARNTARWTILDNGAFEGATIDGLDLVSLASYYSIDEVVVPDVLGDAEATLRSLGTLIEDLDPDEWHNRRYAVVVQGTSYDECCSFIDRVVMMKNTYALSGLKTFCIPKHLGKTTYGNEITRSTIRLRLANYIHSKHTDRFEVHFLGAMPNYIGELAHLQTYNVRSVDTSMPYVYALAYEDLPKWKTPPDIERQEGYFDMVFDPHQKALADANVAYLRHVINND